VSAFAGAGIVAALLLAFGGGIILNLMPQRVIADAESLTVTLERDSATPPATALNGVLVFTDSAVAAPCVLPVLSIKVFALVQHSHAAPAQMRMHGVAYAAGVLVSFAAVAAALMGLRAAGAEIGWGFQLQSPLFVAVMIYILFAVGLNLSGAFSFGFQ